MAVVDETRYLKLAENLAGFRTKLRVRAQTLDVRERQQSPLLSFFQSTSEVRALPPPVLPGLNGLTALSAFRAGHHPYR